MDDLDRRMIKELQADGRAHISTLARRLDVPRSTAQERLKRLLDQGIVKGFEPVLDWAKLDRPVEAHILARFSPDPGVPQREVASKLARIPGVEAVHIISGEWDLILKVRAKDIDAIGAMVLDDIRTIRGVDRTLTCTSFQVELA